MKGWFGGGGSGDNDNSQNGAEASSSGQSNSGSGVMGIKPLKFFGRATSGSSDGGRGEMARDWAGR